jgi:hypothetical protein
MEANALDIERSLGKREWPGGAGLSDCNGLALGCFARDPVGDSVRGLRQEVVGLRDEASSAHSHCFVPHGTFKTLNSLAAFQFPIVNQ